MIILTEDGKKLVDVVSVYIANIPDKEDRNKVFEYKVKGMLPNGFQVLIKTCATEAEAIEFIERLRMDFKANTRAKE